MTGFKTFSANVRRRLLVASGALVLLAALVYGLTLADYVFPGESARLVTQWTGMDALEFPEHPIWGRLVSLMAGLSFTASMALRINLISFVSGLLATGLICWLTAWFVHQTVRQDDVLKLSGGAALLAGISAALVFIFSTAVWQASTHLDYHIFDVAFALAVFALLPLASRTPAWLWILLTIVIGFAAGAGLAESVIFVSLVPLLLLSLVVLCVKGGRNYYGTSVLFLVFAVIGFLVVSNWAAKGFLELPTTAATDYKTVGDVLDEVGRRYTHELRQWFSRPGWLFVFLLATLPFLACAFASVRGLNNERTWSQYLFHTAMTICCILAVATPLSPAALLQPLDIMPVATTTLSAIVCGYLFAYWYLLMRAPLPTVEFDALPIEMRFGPRMAPIAGGLFAGVLLLAFLVNSFSCGKGRGAFADICAKALVDRLGDRSWIVTDGLLDAHLRAVAAERGKELNLICLQRDMDDAYLKELAAFVKAKGLTSSTADLSMSAQLGVLPFIQDWFAGDPAITGKAAVFGVPDLWYMAERTPIPNCLYFEGVKDAKGIDGAKAKAEFLMFWKDISEVLTAEPGQGSRAIGRETDPTVRLRLQLRRHVGFIANNLGVLLQDLGRDDDAWELYELVLKTIDCDNVCSLFNEFEMARKGFKTAVGRKTEIEKALKAIVDDPKRRYLLWSLSRYYGYIRSPEVFARMGFMWARSAQTGNAIAQIRRAIDFVPTERQVGLLNLLAATYASGQQAEKSRAIYEKVLAGDANNHDALMGMMRLSLRDGAIDAAKGYLQKAVEESSGKGGGNGIEWALLHMMNNDLGAARLAMQKVTDLQPKSLQAWCLLAGVLLQQHDQAKDAKAKAKALEELESVILPRMEKLADSPRDYFVQITRALVLLRKGDKFLKPARDAFVLASVSRPDVNVAGDMILDLDIRLDDGDSAEKHARQILRRNRHDKLANYVMGSLRLKEGDYASAESFLRASVSADRPLAAAQNDLAETLRRLQRYDEAEGLARAAVANKADLYVAWETLGACLLDQKKNLDEAETCVKKAIELLKANKKGSDDIRMQITLARVQLAKGDEGRARGTLRALRAKQDELTSYDRRVLEKLLKLAKMQ